MVQYWLDEEKQRFSRNTSQLFAILTNELKRWGYHLITFEWSPEYNEAKITGYVWSKSNKIVE